MAFTGPKHALVKVGVSTRARRGSGRLRRGGVLALALALAAALATDATAVAETGPGARVGAPAGTLPLPDDDAAALANPPGTVSAGNVPMDGTGGDFSVSDVGTAHYEVPLQVVPGRGGLQPRLALTYSSDAGDGQVGTGFSLSGFSQLTRCPKTVAEDQVADGVALNDGDRFCLDGQKLVAVSGTYGANGTEYRTINDSHVRVRSYVAAGAAGQGPTHFVAWTAGGLVQEYGTGGNAVTVSQAGSLLNFARVAWPIVHTSDRSGNVVEYGYDTRKGGGLSTPELERWPTTIHYGSPDHLDRRVEFEFGTRGDRRSGYLYGAPRESTKLLTAVTMSAKVGNTWERARRYELAYQSSAASRASLLVRLTECGRIAGECKRPTELGWASGAAGFQAGVAQTSSGLPLVPTSQDSVLTAADFNGDGRTDLAWPEQDDWRYVYAESGGYAHPADRMVNPWGPKATSFAFDYDLDNRVDLMPRSPSITTYSPILSRGTEPFVRAKTDYQGGFNQVTAGNQVAGGMTGDFDGDGYQDVLEYRKPLGGTGDDFPVKWAWRHRTGTVSPTIDGPDHLDTEAFGPQVELTTLLGVTPDKVLVIDANGDGRDEIIYPTANSAVSLDPLGRVQPFTYFSIRNALLKLDMKPLDVNGDGLTDLMTNGDEAGLKSDTLYVRINTGHEFQTPMAIGIFGGNGLAAAQVVDDDGDGLDDLLLPRHNATDKYIGMDTIHPSINATGLLVFTKATAISFAPVWTFEALVAQGPRVADVDGDGRSDIVLIDRGPTPAMRVFRHASGAQGTAQADLLAEVREGTQAPSGAGPALPATVSVTYAPLTDSAAYQPGACPRTDHQICLTGGARTVVKEVRRDAGVSGGATPPVLVSRYVYVNGRVDKASRAFLGFAQRRVVSSATGGSHGPVTTRTFYSNTSRLDPRPVEEWTFGTLPGGADFLRRTNLDWQERLTAGGAYFGYVASRRVRQYEISPGCPSCLAFWPRAQLDVSGGPPFAGTLERTTGIDQYGNVLSRVTESFGADQSQPQARTTVDSTFDVDAAAWLVSRVKRVVTTDGVPVDGAWTFTTRTVDSEFVPGSTLVKRTRRYDNAANPGRVLTTDLGYDAAGNMVRSSRTDETTGEVRESTFTFDPMGYPDAAMNALGQVGRTGYDPVSGQLEVEVDANGLRTDHTYDSLGRPVRTRQPSGVETTTSYGLEAAGPDLLRRTETRSGTGAVTQLVVDRLGRPVVERFNGFDGAMRQRQSSYEPEGGLAEQTVYRRVGAPGTAQRTLVSYDDLGRVLSTTDPTGAVRRLAYTGLETITTDANSHRSSQVRDARGATVRVVDGLGTPPDQVARGYRYGPFGTLVRTEVEGAPATAATTFGYDAQGQVVSSSDAERGTATSTYNAFGEVVSTRDAEGRETTVEHDALGRLTRSTVTRNGAQHSVLTNQYDSAAGRARAGMLLASTFADFVAGGGGSAAETGTEYFYDELSRVQQVRYRVPAGSAAESLAFTYSYDGFGRTTAIRYPQLPGQAAGAAVAYDYGSAASTNGRLQRVRLTTAPTGDQPLWTAKATDDQDRLTEEQSGDLVDTDVSRDTVGRVTGETLTTAPTDERPSLRLFAESYGYDQQGNLRQRIKTGEDGAPLAESFGYDALDRITSVTLAYPNPCPPGGCPAIQARRRATTTASATAPASEPPPPPPAPPITREVDNWSYDKLGNVTTSKRRGSYHYDPAKPTQVTSVTGGVFGDRQYFYDAVGNQTTRSGDLVTYNDFDLPVRIADSKAGGTAAFLYYPSGERARRTTQAGTTTYVPGLYERQVSGAKAEHRFLVPVDGRTVATVRFGQDGSAVTPQPTAFVHADRLGSTTLVTADTAGAPKAVRATVAEERSYDAFGAPRDPDWRLDDAGYHTDLAPATLDVGFTGHDDDRDLGLVNMSGRVYDPELGRFLTPDTQVAGANATQAWNRYGYVSNNPLTNTDPDGHEDCADCTFWDAGGWGGGGGSGGVWGPSGPDPSHASTDQWIHDSEAFDQGGERAINPTLRDSPEIERGAADHDRGVKAAIEQANQHEALKDLQEAIARYRDAFVRELARLKAQYGEATPQTGGAQPPIAHPGSAATGPNALACTGDCPITGSADDAQAPYEGGVCADGGTSCFVDGAPAPPESPYAADEAAQAAAAATAAAPAPASAPASSAANWPTWPTLPAKPGDSVSVTLGPGTPFNPLAGASVGVTPSVIYNPAASGGYNLALAASGGFYLLFTSVGVSAGYSGYAGWNVSLAVRGGPFFYSSGEELTWGTRGTSTSRSAAVNGMRWFGPSVNY